MRFIVPRDEVDHGDITLLAVPMTAPNALFDALRARMHKTEKTPEESLMSICIVI